MRTEVADRLRKLEAALRAGEQDFHLARQLDAIRQATHMVVDGQWDPAGAAAQYPAAFRAAGYDVETGQVEVVAAKIRHSSMRDALVAALDHWAGYAADPARILAVARGADPDPWRDRLRRVEIWRDAVALENLAEVVDPSQQSPQIIQQLALHLDDTNVDAAPLLRQALANYPLDYELQIER